MQQNSNTDTGDTAVQIQVPPALQPPPSLPPPPSLQLRQKTRESAVSIRKCAGDTCNQIRLSVREGMFN